MTAMLLVLLAFPSQGQEARLLAEPLGVSQPEVCTGSDMVTFTLPTPDPSETVTDVVWSIEMANGGAASYDLNVATGLGADLSDWNGSTFLEFTPLNVGEFAVEAIVTYASASALGFTANGSVQCGEAPDQPIFISSNPLLCEGELFESIFSVTQPDLGGSQSLVSTTLSWELTETATGSVILSDATTSTDALIPGQFGISTLIPGGYDVTLTATNLCGSASASIDVEVVANPEFVIVAEDICFGDSLLVVSDFNLNDYTNVAGDLATYSFVSWGLNNALNPLGIVVEEAWDMSDPANPIDEATYINMMDGDLVSHEVQITYEALGETATCTGTATDDVFVYNPGTWGVNVSYPVTYPPVCEGDTVELSIDCQAIDEACDIVWNVSPAANEYNNSAGNCDACSPTTAIFEDVVFPGILGTVVRTITVTPQLQCVDSVDLGLIEVLPTPEVSWVNDVSLALACFDDNTTSLAVEYTGSNQSPDLVTWDLTNNANNAMWSWVDVVNGGNFSELTFADIDWDALGVDGSQSGSLNVAVSVVDATGCTSDTLDGLIQYFGVPSPDGIVFEPVCEGEDLQPMNVPVGGLEYEWYVNSTDVDPSFEDAFPAFSGLTCEDQIILYLYAEYLLAPGDILVCGADITEFDLQIIPLPEPEFTVNGGDDVCAGDDIELCITDASNDYDVCFSDDTEFAWRYRYNGGIYIPPFPLPALTDTCSPIPHLGSIAAPEPGDCVEVFLTAVNSVDTIPDLTCAVDSIWEFCVLPLPELEVLEAPEWACPNTCFDVNAEDVTTTVLDEFNVQPVSYTWSICNNVPEGTALPTINQPSLLSGMATVCVDAYDPLFDPLCLSLAIVDANGCSDTLVVEVDIKAPVDWSELLVAEPSCDASPLACNELGIALGEPQLFFGDAVTAACSCEPLVLTLTDVVTDPTMLDVDWSWNASLGGQSLAVTSTDSCAFLEPCIDECYDCTSGDSPFESLGLQLSAFTIYDYDENGNAQGCPTSADWNNVVEVYKSPCLNFDEPLGCCPGQDWESDVFGPDEVFLGDFNWEDNQWPTCANNPDVFEDATSFEAGSGCSPVSIAVPCATNIQYTGCSYYPLETQGDVLQCCADTDFELTILNFNPPSPSCLEASGELNDCVVCSGEDVTIESNGIGNPNFGYDWYKDDVFVGSGLSFDLNPVASTCNEPDICDVSLVYTQSYNPNAWPGVTCVDTINTPIVVLPTPTGLDSIINPDLCDGETLEACVILECGVVDWEGTPASWDWIGCEGTIAQSSETESCKETVVEFEGEPCSEIDSQTIEVVITDGYGCASDPIQVNYNVYELPNLTLEGETKVCSDEPVEFTLCGADLIQWSFGDDCDVTFNDLEPAPTACCPGDSTQTVAIQNPADCDAFSASGCLLYPLVSDTLICCADVSESLTVLQAPTLDPVLSPIEGEYCEGDLVTVINNAPCPNDPPLAPFVTGCEYIYATDQGENETSTSDEWTFETLPDATCLSISKICTYQLQGQTYTCDAEWDSCLVVNPKPNIGVLHPEAVCQGETACVEILVNDIDEDCTGVFECFSTDLGSLAASPSSEGCSPCYDIPTSCELQNDIETDVYVVDCNGCQSDVLNVSIGIRATPQWDVIQEFPEEACSPAVECIEFELCNDGLADDVDIFPPVNGAGQICETFQNLTPCPIDMGICWDVLYTHNLPSGDILVCENDGCDSLVVLPSPEFELVVCEQECLDALNGNELILPCPEVATCEETGTNEFVFDWEVIQDGASIQSSTGCTLELTTDTSGVFCPVVAVTNEWGCSNTSPTPSNPPAEDDNCWYVRELPIPILGFDQESICIPTEVAIDNASIGATSYTLEILDTTVVNFESPFIYPVEFPNFYSATIEACKEWLPLPCGDVETSSLICCVETEYDEAFEGCYPPEASFFAPDSIEWVNPFVQFENTSSADATEFNWFFSDGDYTSDENPEHQFTGYGTYSALLEVVNDCGCRDTAFQTIEVWRDIYMYVPNAFTPNNDGLNDAWFPVIRGEENIATYSLQVFSRWGHVVFETNDPTDVWDGGNQGDGPDTGDYYVQNDVYSWRIAIKRKRGEGAEIFTGDVQVIR